VPFTAPLGASRGGDSAELIKVGRAGAGGPSCFLILTNFCTYRLFRGKIGPTLTVVPRHSIQNFTTLRTPGTLL
jgi:hypothetical protein